MESARVFSFVGVLCMLAVCGSTVPIVATSRTGGNQVMPQGATAGSEVAENQDKPTPDARSNLRASPLPGRSPEAKPTRHRLAEGWEETKRLARVAPSFFSLLLKSATKRERGQAFVDAYYSKAEAKFQRDLDADTYKRLIQLMILLAGPRRHDTAREEIENAIHNCKGPVWAERAAVECTELIGKSGTLEDKCEFCKLASGFKEPVTPDFCLECP